MVKKRAYFMQGNTDQAVLEEILESLLMRLDLAVLKTTWSGDRQLDIAPQTMYTVMSTTEVYSEIKERKT